MWDLVGLDWDLEENENGEDGDEADDPERSRGMEIDDGGRRRIDFGGGGGGEGRRGKRTVGEGSSGSAGYGVNVSGVYNLESGLGSRSHVTRW
jgi:hypothetical protein